MSSTVGNPIQCFGVPVCLADEVFAVRKNVNVFVAVSVRYRDEIIAELSRYNVSNIILVDEWALYKKEEALQTSLSAPDNQGKSWINSRLNYYRRYIDIFCRMMEYALRERGIEGDVSIS